MSKEKQIEEMAKVIDDMEEISYIESYDEVFVNTNEIAKHLYNAGYRKQSEGEWIRQQGRPEAVCSNCGREVVYQVVDNKWKFENFCPHCGLKMKGGAE